MNGFELIVMMVALVCEIAAFFLGWVGGGAYVQRLRTRNRRLADEINTLADQLRQSEAALARATGGTEDIIAATYRQDGAGRWSV